MNIKQYKHLFTPVSEGLPDGKGTGSLWGNTYITYDQGIFRFNEFVGDKFSDGIFQLTLWLDLSKLTTKDKAVQLANEVGVAVLLSKVQRGELSDSNKIAELVNNKFEKL